MKITLVALAAFGAVLLTSQVDASARVLNNDQPCKKSASKMYTKMHSMKTPKASSAITDTDILNFALNLEYLEASFYSYAVSGNGLDASLLGGGPQATGGMKANLTGNVATFAAEIANDELDHVKFLRMALGNASVPIPAINIGTAFSAAANAALNTTLKPSFNPYDDDLLFLHGAFIFEDVGVTAYHGAAPLISSKAYLSAAAGILAVEGYHASLVRTLLYLQRDTVVQPYGVMVKAIVQAISDLRGSVGGGKDSGIVGPDNTSNIAPTDSNSIAFARTPAEVIAIVTLGSKNNKGGFFPDGLNGAIK